MSADRKSATASSVADFLSADKGKVSGPEFSISPFLPAYIFNDFNCLLI